MKIPKLDAKINKIILSLESCYPNNNKDVWVTITEMRDRLVHSGVHSSLSPELVKTALTRCNKGGIFMAKRTDRRTSFYRHSLLTHDVGSPLDQRNKLSRYSKRLPINPDIDYLKTHPDASGKLDVINNALLQYANDVDKYESELIKKQTEEKKKAAQKAAFDVAVEKAVAEKLKESSRDDTNTNNNLNNNNEARQVTPPRDPSSIKGNNSNGIFNIRMMTQFIREATEHASECGISINLNEVDKKYGAGIIQKWQCPKCDKMLELRNCNWVRILWWNRVEENRGNSPS